MAAGAELGDRGHLLVPFVRPQKRAQLVGRAHRPTRLLELVRAPSTGSFNCQTLRPCSVRRRRVIPTRASEWVEVSW